MADWEYGLNTCIIESLVTHTNLQLPALRGDCCAWHPLPPARPLPFRPGGWGESLSQLDCSSDRVSARQIGDVRLSS